MRTIVFFAVIAVLAVAISAKPYDQLHGKAKTIQLSYSAVDLRDKIDANRVESHVIATTIVPKVVPNEIAMPDSDQPGTRSSAIRPEKIGLFSFIKDQLHIYRGIITERAAMFVNFTFDKVRARKQQLLELEKYRAVKVKLHFAPLSLLPHPFYKPLSPPVQEPNQNVPPSEQNPQENEVPLSEKEPQQPNPLRPIPTIPKSTRLPYFSKKRQKNHSFLFPSRPGPNPLNITQFPLPLTLSPKHHPFLPQPPVLPTLPPATAEPQKSTTIPSPFTPGLPQKNDEYETTLDQKPEQNDLATLPSEPEQNTPRTLQSEPESQQNNLTPSPLEQEQQQNHVEPTSSEQERQQNNPWPWEQNSREDNQKLPPSEQEQEQNNSPSPSGQETQENNVTPSEQEPTQNDITPSPWELEPEQNNTPLSPREQASQQNNLVPSRSQKEQQQNNPQSISGKEPLEPEQNNIPQQPNQLPSPSKQTNLQSPQSQQEYQTKDSLAAEKTSQNKWEPDKEHTLNTVRKQWNKTNGHFMYQSLDTERIVPRILRQYTPVVYYGGTTLGEMERNSQ